MYDQNALICDTPSRAVVNHASYVDGIIKIMLFVTAGFKPERNAWFNNPLINLELVN